MSDKNPSKKFSKEGKSVRVKDTSFNFKEFEQREKDKKLSRRAKSIIASTKGSAVAEGREKNRATAKMALKK